MTRIPRDEPWYARYGFYTAMGVLGLIAFLFRSADFAAVVKALASWPAALLLCLLRPRLAAQLAAAVKSYYDQKTAKSIEAFAEMVRTADAAAAQARMTSPSAEATGEVEEGVRR